MFVVDILLLLLLLLLMLLLFVHLSINMASFQLLFSHPSSFLPPLPNHNLAACLSLGGTIQCHQCLVLVHSAITRLTSATLCCLQEAFFSAFRVMFTVADCAYLSSSCNAASNPARYIPQLLPNHRYIMNEPSWLLVKGRSVIGCQAIPYMWKVGLLLGQCISVGAITLSVILMNIHIYLPIWVEPNVSMP